MSNKNLITSGQAAERLGVNRTTVHRWAERGDIPIADTVAGIRLFDSEDIDSFAAARAGATS